MLTPKTGESDPLRIAAVTPGDGQGRIGITLCPGKTDPATISGAWDRDLDTDLDAIQRWGATAVISLITDEEIDLLSVRDLPKGVRDRHMEWWHAPIPDGRSPLSPAIATGERVWLSGMLARGDDAEEEARNTLASLHLTLDAAGLGFADVEDVWMYLTDVRDAEAVRTVLAELMPEGAPEPTVAGLPLVGRPGVEIQMTAVRR